MNEEDFLKLCKSKNTQQIINAIISQLALFYLVPKPIQTEEFLLQAISQRIGIFSIISRDLKSKKLCDAAFSIDRGMLRHIPNEFITEDMAYKAALLNGDILSRLEKEHFSERIIDLLIQSGHYDLVPVSLQNTDGIIQSFRATGDLPSRDFWEIKPYVEAMHYILNHKSEFETNKQASKNIMMWENFLETTLASSNSTDYALTKISDDFDITELRALSFIFLKLNEPQIAAKFLNNAGVRDFIIQFHGETILVEHADGHGRRHLIESSLDL